jgi:hypothetical protein
VVHFLKREEAIKVLTDFLCDCPNVDGNWVALIPPSDSSNLSHGYQVHLKTPLDFETRTLIRKILKRYGLSLMYKAEEDLTMVYRPKKDIK